MEAAKDPFPEPAATIFSLLIPELCLPHLVLFDSEWYVKSFRLKQISYKVQMIWY